ncbi:uncharacterized protein A4U43_C04F32260 [Asparagus officinalis]|uniref:GDPGP1-like N-terminal domain-containing protein n=1 Tax=Asparagus officinalis TaxID=4686 RepID=A0A5P1FAF5_ASPOF|nr:uncharacterized protein A4U43_C04F32260 [Asparagus officinalis]
MQDTKPPLSSARYQGIKPHLYPIGNSTKGNCVSTDESLLDALLLSAWEDCSWKDLLKYDVTMCETKNLSFTAEFEKKTLQPLGPEKPTHMKLLRENLLFFIASGEKESCQSQLIPSPAIPMHGFLILVNVNPVEYGHIFLVPYGSVPSACRNVRGATRGKGIERLVTQLGQAISVSIPSSSGAQEGEHATSLANEIGKETRSSTTVHNCGWDNFDAGSREAIIMRVRELGFDYLESKEQLVMTLQAN